MRAVFNAAIEAELIAKSPVRRIRLQRARTRHRPTLTPDELLRLAGAIQPRYRALVVVAGVLGLRWSEAIGLRVADINFFGRTVTVNQTISEVAGKLTVAPTKSHSSLRTMSVPQFVLDELAAHLAQYRKGCAPRMQGRKRCRRSIQPSNVA